MQQPQKAAPEAEAKRAGGFRLIGEGSVVELQFFQRIAQRLIIRAVRRINAAKYHRICPAVTRQAFRGRVIGRCDGIAHLRIAHCFDGCGNIADFSRTEALGGLHCGCTHIADFHNGKLCARGHKAHGIPCSDGAIHQPHINDNAPVAVIY